MEIRLVSLILVLTLVANLAACTTAREMSLPDASDPERPAVEDGQDVTVVLVDSVRVVGEVLAITPDTLLIGKGGNYGWEETALPLEQIVRIETRESTGLTRGFMVIGAVVTAVALLVYIAADSVTLDGALD